LLITLYTTTNEVEMNSILAAKVQLIFQSET